MPIQGGVIIMCDYDSGLCSFMADYLACCDSHICLSPCKVVTIYNGVYQIKISAGYHFPAQISFNKTFTI